MSEPQKKKKSISVQIPLEWKTSLEEEAQKRHLKLSDVVRLIILDHLHKTYEVKP